MGKVKAVNEKPNLFCYATSELSQDAFICWLLAWSDDKYKQTHSEMNQVSRNVLKMFFDKSDREDLPERINIEIRRQYKHIDVLCIINNEYYLVVEDKVGTIQHSQQLERYKKVVDGKNKILIYYQTGSQSSYEAVIKAGFKPVVRNDLLAVFESDSGVLAQNKSDILRDYTQRIRSLEDQFSAYEKEPIKEWGGRAWQGFYIRLQEELKQGSWKYIANQSGGFYGFWWNKKGHNIYLQIEGGNGRCKLVFKIHVKENGKRKSKRLEACRLVMQAFDGTDFKTKKPRFGDGATMTVALLDSSFGVFDSGGLIDIDGTVRALRKIQDRLNKYQG